MATTALDINAQEVAEVLHSCQRDARELTHVILRHLPYFHRMALRRLGNIADAEDAVQDALLSAWAHIDQFRRQAKMSTWLMSIVINSVRIKVRRHRHSSHVQIALDETGQEQNLVLADVLSDHRPSPEEVYRKREFAERLAHAMTQLSPALRRTFQQRDLDGLSICETAHLLGVTDGTVKTRLVRARIRLKKMVKKSLRGKRDAIRSTVA